MRGLVTWAIVGAISALFVLAAVDGVRSEQKHGRAPPSPAPGRLAIPDRSELAAALREAGVTGALAFRDSDCRLRVLHLPGLEESAGGVGPGCLRTELGGERREPSPHGRFVAVRASAGFWIEDRWGRFVGRHPARLSLLPAREAAWSPDDAWLAVAARSSVYLIHATRREVVRLPVVAFRLSWLD